MCAAPTSTDQVFDAVEGVLKSADVGGLAFTAVGLSHMTSDAIPGVGLTMIELEPPPRCSPFRTA